MRRESTLIYSNEGEGDQWGTVPPQWGIVTVGGGGGSMGKCSSEESMGKCSREGVNGEVFQGGGSMGNCSSEGGQWGSIPVRGVKGELFQ